MSRTKQMIFSALFLALALALPFLTGQIPTFGKMLCPMHFPVLLCAFLCGPFWAGAVGLTAPLLRFVLFHAPMMPNAAAMSAELMTYGLVCGILYRLLPKKFGFSYAALITAMISGRLVWGVVTLIISGINSNPFTFSAFVSSAVTESLPGIILQILLIPPVTNIFKKYTSK